MNYYERIQQSIDYIELHLADELSVDEAAKQAYMSVSNYYRMFYSITGYTVKEYIRLRRLSCAATALRDEQQNTLRIIDIAVKYGWTSADGFSRAFTAAFGVTPSEFKSKQGNGESFASFPRMNIMDTLFELQDKALLEKYPDIKVLKKLEPMKVACFSYFGADPEGYAFAAMKKWVNENGIHFNSKNDDGENSYRIFGYNNPDPASPEETYGYEVCVTISDELYDALSDAPPHGEKQTYAKVMRRTLTGGIFAVLSIKRTDDGDIGGAIMAGWQRFMKWIEMSNYVFGNTQYLEEHLGFSDDDEHIGGVELYLPVQEVPGGKLTITGEKIPETIPQYRVAYYRAEGFKNMDETSQDAWGTMLTWAKQHNLNPSEQRLFEFNQGFNPNIPIFQEIMITLPAHFDEGQHDEANDGDGKIKFKDFTGGTYMTVLTNLPHLAETWGAMEMWRKETKTEVGRQQWVEEWFLTGWDFPERSVKVCYPIHASKQD